MELGWLVAGVGLGVVSSFAGVALRDRQLRSAAAHRERRELYARTLSLNDTAYGLVEFLISWPRRVNQDAQPIPGERPTTRAAAIVNNASVELNATLRRSREVAAEIRLIGSERVVPLAVVMHAALEESILALRVDSPVKLERRWSTVGPSWLSAREAFADGARAEVVADR